MVMARVNVAQGELFNALTTTRATAPRRIIMIASTASCAKKPPRLLTSSRAISPRVFPSRRIEQKRMTKSWTQPAKAAPATSHKVPGKYPNCAASVGPMSGPGPAIAAKWWPKRTHLLVGTKSRPSSQRSEGVARELSRARIFAAMKEEYRRYATKYEQAAASTNQVALIGSPRWNAIVESATPPRAAKPIQTTICSKRFILFFSPRGGSWNTCELQQRIDFPKNLGKFFRKGQLRGRGWFHFLADDPALDLFPIFGLDWPAFVFGPFAFHRGVPIAVVLFCEPAFLPGHPLGIGQDTRFRYECERRFLAFGARVNAKTGGHGIARNTHVELAAFTAAGKRLLKLQVHLRFIQGFVLGEADIAIDAGEVSPGAARSIEAVVKLENVRSQKVRSLRKGS